jgi:2-polyprenyl-3-methyl-5-hydroxy-6-metoxy-1,4-benzoquinol methylase
VFTEVASQHNRVESGLSHQVAYGDFAGEVQTDTLEILAGAKHYNQWIFDTFRPYLGPRILEIGCGIGTYTQMLLDAAPVHHVTALEMMPDYIARLQQKVAIPAGKSLTARCQNILETTEGLEAFDGFLMLNVLEHIEADQACLEVLRGLLTPQGRLMVLVPALPALYSNYDRSIQHYRRYTAQSLRQVVTDSGYEIEMLRYFNLVGILGWWLRFCLLKQENFDPASVKAFERLAPMLRVAESVCAPPVGLSLVVVAKARAF